ncbi:MAG TPA: divalent-cation tolerance protein CutA [Lacipirellulaceae bacterium]|nr:divalent-cation tolerance protein CutA [Lacipirellulaceae bacterium]
MSDYLQISTAMGSRDEAARLATAMVERRLAACVQVAGPVQSTYRWQRTLERAEEWLCLIKTTAERYPEVEAAIRELHTYDCPEIVATPIACGSAEYLAWVAEQASPESDDSNQRRASSAQSRPEEGDSP